MAHGLFEEFPGSLHRETLSRSNVVLMESDAAVLELVRNAFSDCSKPQHFTNYEHCEECQDHDDVLRSRDVATLTIKDVGNAGWDPLCETSAEGFAYFFPALARLVLAEPIEPFGWYGPQLFFHLTHDGQCDRFISHFSLRQKNAVVTLLSHIGETRQNLVADYMYVDELRVAIDRWSATDLSS
jgi:hypothetical protein